MITKVKWKNYKALGNLELDFTNATGEPYNTIVLAGENGTGKTTVLESISNFLNLETIVPFDYIEYSDGGKKYHLYYSEDDGLSNLGFHRRKCLDDGQEQKVRSNRNNSFDSISRDVEDVRHYGVAYSKARSGFHTNPVKSSTTAQLDINKYDVDNNDDFTAVKQLMVDISAQDNAEWMRICENGTGESFEQFRRRSKLNRFRKAFNDLFDGLEFERVDETSPDEKKILFRKNGVEIGIDQLSTGEKQIVFRGAQLLKNSHSIAGGIVLIDEPELSMHPRWQEKVLQYYRGLFTQEGQQSAQLIVATHSEYVLKNALKDRGNVLIIALSDNIGTVTSKRITAPSVLPTITAAETNYWAFGIVSTDYHIELYGYLQTKTGNSKVKDCDNYIKSSQDYQPLIHKKPSVYRTTQYETLCTYIRNAIDHPNSSGAYTEEELKTSIELLIKLCQ